MGCRRVGSTQLDIVQTRGGDINALKNLAKLRYYRLTELLIESMQVATFTTLYMIPGVIYIRGW